MSPGNLQIELKSVRVMLCAVQTFFFADPIMDQQNGILAEETRKETSKKVILRTVWGKKSSPPPPRTNI